MLAIALVIGLISALTGNDVLGDINSGTIVDGNGLGGIIGGSGSSTGTGSSSEAPGTTTEAPSTTSGNNSSYKLRSYESTGTVGLNPFTDSPHSFHQTGVDVTLDLSG